MIDRVRRILARGRLIAPIVLDFRLILAVSCAAVAAASALKYIEHPVAWDGVHHASYNNFVIFRNSFLNLVHHRDLYAWHLDQQWDLFKYSPSFALLMAPFAALPTLPGLVAWNLLNTVVLLAGIRLLPFDRAARAAVAWLVLVELVTSTQSAQSNGLVAGLFLLEFAMLERRRPWPAALFAVLNVAVKVFGAVGFALFLLYPVRRRALVASITLLAAVAALPLLVVTPAELAAIYGRWLTLLREDTVRANTVSVYGWLASWFHLFPPRNLVLAAGAVLLVLPLARVRLYGERSFRLLVLAAMLVWVVIFNHKAESPTFVIAMCGIATWFFVVRASRLNVTLLVASFVLVSLSPTDVFPAAVRHEVLEPFAAKAVPCIAVWALATRELLFGFGPLSRLRAEPRCQPL